MVFEIEREIGGRKLRIETGRMARQACGAVVVQYGGTVILATVVDAPPRENIDFFPLIVDYREKGYAAGLIFGGRFFKREGRPTEKEITTMRAIDRPVRPLWPKSYDNEVLISIIVLSADKENDPDVPAMVGASAALWVSHLPFQGPIATVRVGLLGEEFVLNPTQEQRKESSLDLIVTGKKDGVVMIEGGAKEIPEDKVIDAVEFALPAVQEMVEMQLELAEKVGVVRDEIPPPDKSLSEKLAGELERAKEALQTPTKFGRRDALRALKDELKEKLGAGEDAPSEKEIKHALQELEAKALRSLAVEGKRADGRSHDEVRQISCEVGFLPWTHGSALFTRGETQALVVTTLGTVSDRQYIETLEGESILRFLLHYNFPSFSVGEVKMPRGPSRREIGHGRLALRAMEPVLPPPEEFPYTIRVVSDVLESNGSSSMASVCGATLCLMDSGVPIKDPVAGVAMGLIKEGEEHYILSDILGDEDHYGDMDFKAAGTQHGVTAVQLDVKIPGISTDAMRKTLHQAREARMTILKTMLEVLPRPRAEIPDYAPKIVQLKVPVDKIGRVIGETLTGRFDRARVVGSTDLTHHGGHFPAPGGRGSAGQQWARDNDRKMIELIESMSAEQIIPQAQANNSACGAGAIAAAITACSQMGATRGICLEYTNSYEIVHALYPDEADGPGGRPAGSADAGLRLKGSFSPSPPSRAS